jgi:hypothetical protein
MRRRFDPVHVHEVLKRERALEPELFGPHTEEELRACARALGREDLLSDPQKNLELSVPA